MKMLSRIWLWFYPKPPMLVDSTAAEYYHRSVERQLHWSERTDLKLQRKRVYAPCK